ncbi:MAG: carboxylate-amine ligase [Ktedonobacteraceae bacterium]|nr:carboxylate-amine ligase [Ktedonobacteraceae bacterium]
MQRRFTLGIEEEFQLVDAQTGELRSVSPRVLEKCGVYFGEQRIKPEILQSMVEHASTILPNIQAAREELYATRATLSRCLTEEGLALISAGTHPGALWWEHRLSDEERYHQIEAEYQDVGRSVMVFGLHIHVSLGSQEMAVALMNQVRNWLPHLLALSSNSPFWMKRMTGIKSYRSVVWRRFPRSGTPELFVSAGHFERYVQDLIEMGCIDNAKKIWWDVRPHPFYGTLEFRICDMPATLEDTLALAALCQALVAKLTWLYERGEHLPVLERDYLEENKWRAVRYGLDAEVLDFVRRRRLNMRDAIHELLEFVDDVVDELGIQREVLYLHSLISDPRGTGADRQIALYEAGGDIEAVQRYLMHQTLQGIAPDELNPPRQAMHFFAPEPM